MNPQKPDNSKQKLTAGLVALVVIALLAGGSVIYSNNQNAQTTVASNQGLATTPTAGTSTTSGATSPASSSSTSTSSAYKDGTYSATSNYYVPHGSEWIKVSLTITGGTVTSSSIENSEDNRESAQFQEQFASEYKSYVIGKPVSSLQLDYVAGASDTTQGFNDALQQIKTEAQA